MSLRCSNEADIEQQRLCDFESGVGGKLPDPHGLSMPIYDRSVSMQRKLIALLGYFVCNVGLTIYNKAILGKVNMLTSYTALTFVETIANSVCPLVHVSMASHLNSCCLFVRRVHYHGMARTLPHQQAHNSREPRLIGIFVAVHDQHRGFQPVPVCIFNNPKTRNIKTNVSHGIGQWCQSHSTRSSAAQHP